MLPRQSPRTQQQAPADTTVSLASWGPDPPPYRITHRFPLQRILPPIMSSPPPCHHHPLHHHPWATHVGSQDSRCESYPTRQPWTKLSHGLPRPWWWSWVVLDVGERGACYRSSCSPFLGHRRGGQCKSVATASSNSFSSSGTEQKQIGSSMPQLQSERTWYLCSSGGADKQEPSSPRSASRCSSQLTTFRRMPGRRSQLKQFSALSATSLT
jgi:hypothetical protein